MPVPRVRELHEDDLDQVVRVWEESRSPGQQAVHSLAEVLAAVRESGARSPTTATKRLMSSGAYRLSALIAPRRYRCQGPAQSRLPAAGPDLLRAGRAAAAPGDRAGRRAPSTRPGPEVRRPAAARRRAAWPARDRHDDVRQGGGVAPWLPRSRDRRLPRRARRLANGSVYAQRVSPVSAGSSTEKPAKRTSRTSRPRQSVAASLGCGPAHS
jgi:hypothetical protein